jgi:RNA recognition motif-containing protein
MSVRLFVSNLPYDVTEAELREYFSAVGSVSFLSLPTDRETGRPRGFAFIEFGDRAQAEEAIRRFNNQSFMGRPLVVNEARPREDRPPSSAPFRPAVSRPDASLDRSPPEAAAPNSKPSRNFGPDATPRRNRNKGKGGAKSDRGPKGPMRERVTGQFYGGDDGDDEDDDFGGEDFHDYKDDWEDEADVENKV